MKSGSGANVLNAVSNDGTKTADFELISNATIGGTQNFQNIGTNLATKLDVSGTTVADGRRLVGFEIAKGNSTVIDLTTYNITIPPWLDLTIAAKMDSGSASDLTASLIWYEDV